MSRCWKRASFDASPLPWPSQQKGLLIMAEITSCALGLGSEAVAASFAQAHPPRCHLALRSH